MPAISIHELHENTDLWVRKATEQESIVLTDNGQAVAKIVPLPVANPKASNLDHVRENAAAPSIKLTADDLAALDAAFAPPDKKRPLQML